MEKKNKTSLQRAMLEIYQSNKGRGATQSEVFDKVLSAMNEKFTACRLATKYAKAETKAAYQKNDRLQQQVTSLMTERDKHAAQLSKLRAAEFEWKKLVGDLNSKLAKFESAGAAEMSESLFESQEAESQLDDTDGDWEAPGNVHVGKSDRVTRQSYK
jgi:hypothetical protein